MFKIGDRINAVTECFWKSEWQNCIVNRINEYGDLYVTNPEGVEGLLREYQAELVKETTQMFEVGKKYKSKYSGTVYDCIWIKENEVLLRNPRVSISHESAVYGTRQDSFAGYVEYVEPKVVEQELYVKCDEKYFQKFWLSSNTDVFKESVVGKIRVIHTEGQGIKIEVLG